MKIVINTYKKGITALEHLLDSMKKHPEFYEYNIIVCVGGYYENEKYLVKPEENITYIYCNHNSIDYTGLITLLELCSENTDDYYFYLHDTCLVGDSFFQKLKNINLENLTSLKINRHFSMNIGIYSQKIINKNANFLLSKKNTEESKCFLFKTVNFEEDYIFNTDDTNVLLDDYDGWMRTEPVDYYKTGTPRIIEYYPNIDLYKIKANWGGRVDTLTL